jgi:hypothetical protein
MPGSLTQCLQRHFPAYLPEGWQCHPEKRLLGGQVEKLLGYSPVADVLLECLQESQRVWVEFEVSRADPVANHATFASSRLFCPDLKSDAFVSMISSHVTRGRRNLASGAIFILRNVGMKAFQTVLFPSCLPDEIKRLNHLSLQELERENLDVGAECRRALAVVKPLAALDGHKIHFTSDPFEVMVNLERWNQEILEEYGQRLWGRRRVAYFAYNPASGSFAPSKFCAFIPVGPVENDTVYREGPVTMTVGLYCGLDEDETRFDGNIAWRHLKDRLGFEEQDIRRDAELLRNLEHWLKEQEKTIELHPKGPVILAPPKWFWR